MSHVLSLNVRTDLEALAMAQATVRGFLADQGVDGRCSAAVDVVLEELGANVIRHGRPADGSMRLSVEVQPGRVVATLDDTGPAFDPTTGATATAATSLAEARTGGRGLMLARRLTQSITYARAGDRNHLAFAFERV